MKLILLTSGGLGLHVLRELKSRTIAGIYTDKQSVEIQDFARDGGIPLFTGNPRKSQDFGFIAGIPGAWLLSVNYLFIIPPAMIDAAGGRALNIHGSLLPKYRGRTPHVWSIINGERAAGATVHRMSEGVDEGDILVQEAVPIGKDDTGGSLLGKYREIYPGLIRKALDLLERGEAVFHPQDHSKATYFPKRTAADGRIDWNWQSGRIIDWVRAQTRPYPGAFSLAPRGSGKIIVWKCMYDDAGFKAETPNGTVLSADVGNFKVKCANQVVRVTEWEGEILPGDVLN